MRQCDKCKRRNECNTFKKSLTDDTKYLFGCDAFEEEDTAPKFDKVNLEKLTKMPEFDLEGYQSPIEIVYDKLTADFNIQLENNVMTAVQRYGIQVNRDELIKALNYDRDQYVKGYRDAALKFAPEWVPITTRKMTEEEKKEILEKWEVYGIDEVDDWVYDCPLPDNGQEVLITTKVWGKLAITTFHSNIESYFDDYEPDEIAAWMSLPKPYGGGETEGDNE